MKGRLTLFFISLISSSLFAQDALYYQEEGTFEYGLRVGFVTSVLNSDFPANGNKKILFTYMGGFFGRYQVNKRFSIQGEVDLARRGSGFENADNVKLAFLDIPVTAVFNVRFKLGGTPMTFDIFGGLQPSFLLSAKSGTADIKSQFKTASFDLVVGSGFPVWRFLFYATTKIGLSDINNNFQGDESLSIRSISTEWTLSYRINGK